ncbi:hypothetical protein D3C86_1935860 [compost metagenome]
MGPNCFISAPVNSGPMLAPTPKVISNIAVSDTRRSASIWSLENATASGYRLNCSRQTRKPTGNSTSRGAVGMIARGKADTASKAAVLRISTARS